MQLPNLKELSALLKLCRKQGITEITLGDVSVKFGDMPMVIKGGEAVAADPEALMPTDEEMAYWSSAPDPLAAREGTQ